MTGTNRKGIIVQERDRQFLRELAIMCVVDREQAKCAAGFTSTTRANVRLLALKRAGLLRRFFVGTIGGRALYALSPTGAKLVGVPFRGPRRKTDETLVADFFVMHQLRVNDVYTLLKRDPTRKLVRWIAFHESLESGRSLIPDGYCEIAASGKTIAAFLEIDLGHESRTVWKGKVEAYLRYAASGNFAKQFGHAQFRVLVIANSVKRIQSLRAATASVTEKIFWFASFEEIAKSGFWSAIWMRPQGDALKNLLD